MTRRRAAPAAAWTTPALLALVATRVASGHPEAPLLILLAVAAPLVALLRARAPAVRNAATRASVIVVVALIVCANVIVFADLASLLGGARWHGAVLAAALTLLATMWPAADRRRALVLAIGVTGVITLVAAAAVAGGRTPWSAWNDVASRAALAFPARGAEARFTRDTTLEFTEVHDLVALQAGALRVTEQHGTHTIVREWLVRDGDVLTLRPGDRLFVTAGARLRFEGGKRVPGAPASGVHWADAAGGDQARAVAAGLGLAMTLFGGAATLVPPWRRVRGAAAGAPLVCGWAAMCCGVYAVAMSPGLVLADVSAAALFGVTRTLPRGAAVAVTVVGGAGLLVLLVCAAQSLRVRLMETAGASAPATWTVIFALAAAGAIWPVDASHVLTTALGLGACAVAAPLVAAGDHDHGGLSPAAVGSLAGALVFGALTALAVRLPEWAGVGDYPALLAAPAAWMAAVTARRLSARRAGDTARSPCATSGR